jgi:general secretion pathway protein G
LVITVSVLAILTLGVIPVAQLSIKRQKEEQLRASLREMREAIDQFRREAVAGAQAQVNQQQVPGGENQNRGQMPVNVFADSRIRVFITDQTIFNSDNPDRYPPDLETLVNGVDVLPLLTAASMGGRGDRNVNATDVGSSQQLIPKTKIYLRRIPIDPMTGKADWCIRSSYDTADASCEGGGENVFDVYSRSDGTSLNGEKYRDW